MTNVNAEHMYFVGSTVQRAGKHPFRVEIKANEDGTVGIRLQRITVSATQLKYGGYDESTEVMAVAIQLGELA